MRSASASRQESPAGAGDAGLPEAEQLRAAQAAMQQLQERIDALQAQQAAQQQQQGQQQAALPLPAPEPQPRRQLVQPQQLQYETAAQGSTLADWLFDVDRLFRQLGLAEGDAARRIAEASLHWDRQVDLWWRGREQQARTAGAPIASWAAFVAALQANFVPTGDAEAAARELLRLRMKATESMDAYMQRAALLLARADSRIDAATAARIAVEGVDSSRFPFALAAVRASMRRKPTMPFNEVRLELTEAAAHEPGLAAPSVGSSGGAHRQSASSSGRQGASQKQLRISALERQLQQLRAGDSSEDEAEGTEPVHTAPLGRQRGAGSGGHVSGKQLVCNKCGAAGHVVSECRSKKDQRTCFVCGQPGHIAMRCEQRKGGGGGSDGSGPEGAPKPKNA